jgi:hypothetical protein
VASVVAGLITLVGAAIALLFLPGRQSVPEPAEPRVAVSA